MQTVHLSHKHTRTIERVFQHPASHNLQWRDVIALMEHMGSVQAQENGHLAFTVNGVTEVFRRDQEKDVSEMQEVLDLRHFLEPAGSGKSTLLHIEDTPVKDRRTISAAERQPMDVQAG